MHFHDALLRIKFSVRSRDTLDGRIARSAITDVSVVRTNVVCKTIMYKLICISKIVLDER